MVKCPYCGREGSEKVVKSWKFRFYNVERMECGGCGKKYNRYKGVSSRGKASEFVIRL
ncbi:MAG: hypothetical protein H5T34_05955 [Candidatus Methanomethyliales bacterium]|nr:hypothetical protein [Candidatus Methanomethylicales archaeon]